MIWWRKEQINEKKVTMKEAIAKGYLVVKSVYDPICGLRRTDEGNKCSDEDGSKVFYSDKTIEEFFNDESMNRIYRNYIVLNGWQVYFGHLLKRFWVKNKWSELYEESAFNIPMLKNICLEAGIGKIIEYVEVKKRNTAQNRKDQNLKIGKNPNA